VALLLSGPPPVPPGSWLQRVRPARGFQTLRRGIERSGICTDRLISTIRDADSISLGGRKRPAIQRPPTISARDVLSFMLRLLIDWNRVARQRSQYVGDSNRMPPIPAANGMAHGKITASSQEPPFCREAGSCKQAASL
jgi:hypothetical protein